MNNNEHAMKNFVYFYTEDTIIMCADVSYVPAAEISELAKFLTDDTVKGKRNIDLFLFIPVGIKCIPTADNMSLTANDILFAAYSVAKSFETSINKKNKDDHIRLTIHVNKEAQEFFESMYINKDNMDLATVKYDDTTVIKDGSQFIIIRYVLGPFGRRITLQRSNNPTSEWQMVETNILVPHYGLFGNTKDTVNYCCCIVEP